MKKNSMGVCLKNGLVKHHHKKVVMPFIFIMIAVLFMNSNCHGFDFKSLFGLSKKGEMVCVTAEDGRKIDTNDPDYPLEFVKDCYKFITVIDIPVKNAKGHITSKKKARWEWKYIVKNKSPKLVIISFKYYLCDVDDFKLAEGLNNNSIRHIGISPSETIQLEGTIFTPPEIVEKVDHSSWNISLEKY